MSALYKRVRGFIRSRPAEVGGIAVGVALAGVWLATDWPVWSLILWAAAIGFGIGVVEAVIGWRRGD